MHRNSASTTQKDGNTSQADNTNRESKIEIPDFKEIIKSINRNNNIQYLPFKEVVDVDGELHKLDQLKTEELEELANGKLFSKGNPKAQFVLAAKFYLKGWKDSINPPDEYRKKWMKKSADQDYLPALLGLIRDTSSNENIVNKFLKLASKGDTDALYYYAVAHEKGWGVSEDKDDKTIGYYIEAALKGNVGAILRLKKNIEEKESTPIWQKAASLYANAREGNLEAALDFSIVFLNLIDTTGRAKYKVLFHDFPIKKEILTWINNASTKGNIRAHAILSSRYTDGFYVYKRDEDESKKYLTKACDTKSQHSYFQNNSKLVDPEGQAELGRFYLNCHNDQAIVWLKKAAENADFISHNTTVEYNIGVCYKIGLGVPKDEEKAFEYYQKSARKESGPAKEAAYELSVTLGSSYFNNKDPKAALWIKRALDLKEILPPEKTLDLPRVRGQLEYMYANCHETGLGVTQDYEIANQYYKKVDHRNDSAKLAINSNNFKLSLLKQQLAKNTNINIHDYLLCDLGELYLEMKDEKNAFAAFKSASEYKTVGQKKTHIMGQEKALFRLGKCYEEGIGTQQSLTEAAIAYNSAAKLKHPESVKALDNLFRKNLEIKIYIYSEDSKEAAYKSEALYKLGMVYLSEVQDAKKAFETFKMLSDTTHSHHDALFYLGKYYEEGKVIEKNITLALVYYRTSAMGGYTMAKNRRTDILKKVILPSANSDSSLIDLDLSYSNFDNGDLIQLQQLLISNTTIVTLDLTGTLVTEQYVDSFAKGLKRPTALEILHSDNKKSISLPRQSDVQRDNKLNIPDNYKIEYTKIKCEPKPLAEGGFAVVYKGEYDHAAVAVKQLKSKVNPESIKEFEKEVLIMVQLQSPYVVRIYGYCLEPNCLVTELMERGSLYHLLRSDKVFEVQKRYVNIALNIAYGISHLHGKNIVHGDLKSLNILVNEQYHAKVADFGMSKITQLGNQSLVSTNDAGGSTRWMAPELFTRGKPVKTKKSDVYSYGRILTELVTGQIPFADVEVAAIIPGLIVSEEKEPLPDTCPTVIREAIRFCLFKDPEKRHNIEAIITLLESESKKEDSPSNNVNNNSTLNSGYMDNLASFRIQ